MNRLLILGVAVVCAGAVARCGKPPSDPSPPQASLTLSANPSPIAGTECTGCGAATTERETVTTLTIRETNGVAANVNSISMTLRDAAGSVIASGEFTGTAIVELAGSSRVGANGALSIPGIGVHYARELGGRSASLLLTVRAVDDRGYQISRELTVPVTTT